MPKTQQLDRGGSKENGENPEARGEDGPPGGEEKSEAGPEGGEETAKEGEEGDQEGPEKGEETGKKEAEEKGLVVLRRVLLFGGLVLLGRIRFGESREEAPLALAVPAARARRAKARAVPRRAPGGQRNICNAARLEGGAAGDDAHAGSVIGQMRTLMF